MPSAWIAHVKKFATEHKMKFGEALADKRCSASYKSLQTSTARHGPTGFLPVDAVPKKKSAKRKTGSSKSSSKRTQSKRTQSKKTKNNSKSKLTKVRSRGKKSSTKTQSAGGLYDSDYEKLSIYPYYPYLLSQYVDSTVNQIIALYKKEGDKYPKHVFFVNSQSHNTLNTRRIKNKIPIHFQSIIFEKHFRKGSNDEVIKRFDKDSKYFTPKEIYTNVTKSAVGSNKKLQIKFNRTSKKIK